MLLMGADFPHIECVNPMGKVCAVDLTPLSVRGSSISMGFEKISSGASVQEAETSKAGDKTA